MSVQAIISCFSFVTTMHGGISAIISCMMWVLSNNGMLTLSGILVSEMP
jgi:hypothetical protein